jgi:hypothetical protein
MITLLFIVRLQTHHIIHMFFSNWYSRGRSLCLESKANETQDKRKNQLYWSQVCTYIYIYMGVGAPRRDMSVRTCNRSGPHPSELDKHCPTFINEYWHRYHFQGVGIKKFVPLTFIQGLLKTMLLDNNDTHENERAGPWFVCHAVKTW